VSGESQRFEERVLIIEDDADYRRYLELRLQHGGAVTWLSATGEEGLDAVAEFQPSVVITDIGLPGIDGLTVCRRIRSDPTLRRLPVLILSSADHSAEIGEVVGLGLIWYLRKGCDWQVTARTLRNLIARARDVPIAS
jgi:two-component system response regulator MprA